MQLIARIQQDLLEARKARLPAAGPLSALVGSVQTKEKTFVPQRPVTDAEVVAVVKTFLNGLDDTLADLGKASTPDQARIEAVKAERAMLAAYMPQQMDEQGIRDFIVPRVAAGEAMGPIMGALKAERGGQYDGAMASRVVREAIAARG